MAVTRADKEAELQRLETAFKGCDSAILVDYKGMNVPQVTELRRQLRSAKASYTVVKNTLAKRALKGTLVRAARKILRGNSRLPVNHIAAFFIKLVGMLVDIPDVQDAFRNVGIQVLPIQIQHVKFVVRSEHDGDCARFAHSIFKILDKRPTNPKPLVGGLDRQRVQFIHVAVILRNTANPTHRVTFFA